jgi:hypothetical protein
MNPNVDKLEHALTLDGISAATHLEAVLQTAELYRLTSSQAAKIVAKGGEPARRILRRKKGFAGSGSCGQLPSPGRDPRRQPQPDAHLGAMEASETDTVSAQVCTPPPALSVTRLPEQRGSRATAPTFQTTARPCSLEARPRSPVAREGLPLGEDVGAVTLNLTRTLVQWRGRKPTRFLHRYAPKSRRALELENARDRSCAPAPSCSTQRPTSARPSGRPAGEDGDRRERRTTRTATAPPCWGCEAYQWRPPATLPGDSFGSDSAVSRILKRSGTERRRSICSHTRPRQPKVHPVHAVPACARPAPQPFQRRCCLPA